MLLPTWCRLRQTAHYSRPARQLQRNKSNGFPERNEVTRTVPAAERKSRRMTAKQKDLP